MKLSDYFTNILSAIFTPNSIIEREDTYKRIIKNNDDIIKSQGKLNKSYDDTLKLYRSSYDTLEKTSRDLIRENHRLNEINTVLNNKLQRYYKTGKNTKKK